MGKKSWRGARGEGAALPPEVNTLNQLKPWNKGQHAVVVVAVAVAGAGGAGAGAGAGGGSIGKGGKGREGNGREVKVVSTLRACSEHI